MAVSDRHLFILHYERHCVAAYPFGEALNRPAPHWQTRALPDGSLPSAITVCGGDWLLIGDFHGNAVAAVDLRGPPSERKVSAPIPLTAVGMSADERLWGLRRL